MNEKNNGGNNKPPVFVTGQQIGLLGGPLYTTYKVLGAIFLAEQHNGSAVYWLETNDADFNEINHIDFLDAEGQLKTLTWDISSGGYSCGYIEVDAQLVSLLETFFNGLRQTEYTPALKAMVLECYTAGRTLGDASLELARRLFDGLDARLFTPFEPSFREFSQEILLREAERTLEGQQCNCFCMIGKQRKALFKEGGQFRLRDGTVVNPAEQVLVPNVRTRSVCQDAFFHTHSYIAGPGEVAYLAEMGPAYEFLKVTRADVQPRMSISLLEPRVKRLLEKYGIPLETVLDTERETFNKQQMETHAGFNIKENARAAETLTDGYLEQLAGLGLEPVELKQLRKVFKGEVKKAFGAARARQKKKHAGMLADIAFLSDNLRPRGKKQERVFNIVYYLNLYGPDFIRRLYENHDFKRNFLEIN